MWILQTVQTNVSTLAINDYIISERTLFRLSMTSRSNWNYWSPFPLHLKRNKSGPLILFPVSLNYCSSYCIFKSTIRLSQFPWRFERFVSNWYRISQVLFYEIVNQNRYISEDYMLHQMFTFYDCLCFCRELQSAIF